jgi:hypothetical protein
MFFQEIIAYDTSALSSSFGEPPFECHSAKDQRGATRHSEWGHPSHDKSSISPQQDGAAACFNVYDDLLVAEDIGVFPASQHLKHHQDAAGGHITGSIATPGAADWFRDHKRKRGATAGIGNSTSFVTAAELFGGLNNID